VVGSRASGVASNLNVTSETQSSASGTQSTRPARLTRARRTAILKAIADPRRYELLERVARAGCPLPCSEVRAALPISAATLSHHVKELQTAGLIEVERDGRFHRLTLRPGALVMLIDTLESLVTPACGGPAPGGKE